MMRFLLLSHFADEQAEAQKMTLLAQGHTASEQWSLGMWTGLPHSEASAGTSENSWEAQQKNKPYPGTTPEDILLYFPLCLCVDIFLKINLGAYRVFGLIEHFNVFFLML